MAFAPSKQGNRFIEATHLLLLIHEASPGRRSRCMWVTVHVRFCLLLAEMAISAQLPRMSCQAGLLLSAQICVCNNVKACCCRCRCCLNASAAGLHSPAHQHLPPSGRSLPPPGCRDAH